MAETRLNVSAKKPNIITFHTEGLDCADVGSQRCHEIGAMTHCEAYAAIHRFFYFHIVHSPPFYVTLHTNSLLIS